MKNMRFSELLEKHLGDMSQTDLAKAVGISPAYVMLLTSAKKRPPPLSRCLEIANALHLSKEDSDKMILSAAEERIKKPELDAILTLTHKKTHPISELKKVVIRINARGNAEIVSKDPGVSVSIQYEDDDVVVPAPKHEIKPIKTDKNRIHKHSKV